MPNDIEIKIPKTLNEAIIGKCNMEFPDDKTKVYADVPIVYADAINTHLDRIDKIEDDFKEADKNVEEFEKINYNRDNKVKGTEDMRKMKLSESLFEEIVEDTMTKERKRSKNDSKEDRLYSSEDLWLQVYDELSTDIRNAGANDVHKELKAKRGERYEQVFPHGDNDIIVYGTRPEDFEFARRVADHYGVKAEEPKEDKNSKTNKYYKYSMVIRIPQD